MFNLKALEKRTNKYQNQEKQKVMKAKSKINEIDNNKGINE